MSDIRTKIISLIHKVRNTDVEINLLLANEAILKNNEEEEVIAVFSKGLNGTKLKKSIVLEAIDSQLEELFDENGNSMREIEEILRTIDKDIILEERERCYEIAD